MTPLSTIIITANIVSRPTVGAPPPSITVLISITSMRDDAEGQDQRAVGLAEHLRQVVGGDDHAERAPQDHAQDPDEQQRADRDASRLAFDSSESPKSRKARP